MNNTDEIIHLRALRRAEGLLRIMSFIYRQPLMLMFIAVILSVILNMILVRTCWTRAGQNGSINLICGDIGQVKTSHWLMLSTFAGVTDNIVQSSDFNSNMSVKNLIDGDEITQAYPSQKSFDYAVELFERYKLERIEIKWGNYGLGDQYIDKWTLRGKGSDEQWFVISQGLAPQTEKTIINQNITISELRLTAQSQKNWIGVYEIKLKGLKY